MKGLRGINPQAGGEGGYVNKSFFVTNVCKSSVETQKRNNYIVQKDLGRLLRGDSLFFQEELIEEGNSGRNNPVTMWKTQCLYVGVDWSSTFFLLSMASCPLILVPLGDPVSPQCGPRGVVHGAWRDGYMVQVG